MGDRDSDYGDSHYDPLGADSLQLGGVDLTIDEVTQEAVAQALAQDQAFAETPDKAGFVPAASK